MLCPLTPDAPLLTPTTPALQPDGYDCGPSAGGGTPAVSSRARATELHSRPVAGLASRPRAGTLTSGRGG